MIRQFICFTFEQAFIFLVGARYEGAPRRRKPLDYLPESGKLYGAEYTGE